MGLFDFFKKENKATKEKLYYPCREIIGIEENGYPFPRGVKDLAIVKTSYGNEDYFICYTFTDRTLNALNDVALAVNNIIKQTANLACYPFPILDRLKVAVPVSDCTNGFWDFCRVEYSPKTRAGEPSRTPTKLYLIPENSHSPFGINGKIWFDTNGILNKAEITINGEHYSEWNPANLDRYKIDVGTLQNGLTIKRVTEYVGENTLVMFDHREEAALRKKIEKQLSNHPNEINNELTPAEEGNQLRKGRMEQCGIDVSLFTEDKAKADLSNIINTLIPSFLLFQSGQPRFKVDFSDLTKTGKAPKNVCTVHLDTYSENVFWIAHIKYLASGIVNMIDLHLWKDHIRHGVSIRTVNNEYRITAIIRQDSERDISDTLYLNNKPENNNEQISILDESIPKLFM